MFGLRKRSDKTVLEFDRDQTLVLFELLRRWNDDASQPTPSEECFQSPAELVVLKQIDEMLKALLDEPFRPDYLEIIRSARERLADRFVVGVTLQD